jgi:hypothetical protein
MNSIFPNLEAELIRTLREILETVDNNVLADIHVGVTKSTDYKKQITVRSDGGPIVDRRLKDEGFGINIWTDDFAEASEIALIVEAVLPMIPQRQKTHIKQITISLSATRINEEGTEEQRYLTGVATVGSVPIKFKP